ncbi:MAG: DUF2283 domain-containing protein, partial [Candidatus Thermoplasmatota archaeon]
MKVSYNRTDDVLIFEVGEGDIDHAEEVGPFIVHFDKKGTPILLEILDASEFLSQTTKITMKAKEGEKVEL